MNKQQKAYAKAKATAEALFEAMKENEARFIVEAGITNSDGTTPKSLYLIEDDAAMERACDDYMKSPLYLDDEYHKARVALENAEEELIEYGISIAPAGIRETLERGKKQARIRKKLIDLAFRLDTRTVPKRI